MFQKPMQCPLCSRPKAHGHGKTSSGSQRYCCPNCKQTFTDTFGTIYYQQQVREEEVRIILQSHCEGTSLRGSSRISGLSYNTLCQPRPSGAFGHQLLQLD